MIVEELKEKEHQEQEAEERREQEAKERREQEVKERQELEAEEEQEQEAKEQVEQEAKERDQTAKEQQETDEYRALISTRETPEGRKTGSDFVKSNQHVLAAKKFEGTQPNKLEVRSNGAGT